jgi:hypothetical protein
MLNAFDVLRSTLGVCILFLFSLKRLTPKAERLTPCAPRCAFCTLFLRSALRVQRFALFNDNLVSFPGNGCVE